MTRRRAGLVMWAVIVALAGVVVGTARPAGAAGSQTYTVETPLVPGDWDTTLTVPRFDPALGSLTGVHVQLAATVRATTRVENLSGGPAEVNARLGARARFDVPFEWMLLGVHGVLEPVTEQSVGLGGYDGRTDFDGASGAQLDAVSADASYRGDFAPGPFLIGFIGTGDVELPAQVVGSSAVQAANGGALQADVVTAVSLRLVITYDYARTGIAVSVTPAEQTVVAGDAASFSVTVRNLGELALHDVVVGSETVPDCDQTVPVIAPGAEVSLSCRLGGVVAPVVNHVVVGGETAGSYVSGQADASVTVGTPALAVQLVPPAQTVARGGPARFTVTVTNRGTVALRAVAVEDSAVAGCARAVGDLPAGGETSYQCSGVANASFVNRLTARASAGVANPQTLRVDATANVSVAAPKAAVALSARVNGADATVPPGVVVGVGSPLVFTYLVTNSGDVGLDAVAVSDTEVGGVACPAAALAPGESMTCQAEGRRGDAAPRHHEIVVTAVSGDGRVARAATALHLAADAGEACTADGVLDGLAFSVNGGPPVADLRTLRVTPGDTLSVFWTSNPARADGCQLSLALYSTPAALFAVDQDQTLVGWVHCVLGASDVGDTCRPTATAEALASASPAASMSVSVSVSASAPGAAPGPATGGTLAITVPASIGSAFQLDVVTGAPLRVVGPGGGFYSAVLTGAANRLVAALNADAS